MGDWSDETAEWYANKYGEYDTNRLAVAALDLDPGARIVDVGCGTGCGLRHAAAKVTHGNLIGIDPAPRMIAIARERAAGHAAASRLEFRVGPAEALPVEDACADRVFAFDSFDHWDDKPGGLAEIRRVLRPAGKLVVVKDGGVPGGAEARASFIKELADAGFVLEEERSIAEGDVACVMWICALGA